MLKPWVIFHNKFIKRPENKNFPKISYHPLPFFIQNEREPRSPNRHLRINAYAEIAINGNLEFFKTTFDGSKSLKFQLAGVCDLLSISIKMGLRIFMVMSIYHAQYVVEFSITVFNFRDFINKFKNHFSGQWAGTQNCDARSAVGWGEKSHGRTRGRARSAQTRGRLYSHCHRGRNPLTPEKVRKSHCLPMLSWLVKSYYFEKKLVDQTIYRLQKSSECLRPRAGTTSRPFSLTNVSLTGQNIKIYHKNRLSWYGQPIFQ